jgi:hypothetical protein
MITLLLHLLPKTMGTSSVYNADETCRMTSGMISSFFWVTIDLIIGFLGLIIKAFDNQTEI